MSYLTRIICCLNESPSEKEGKCRLDGCFQFGYFLGLNESPSEKEGKSVNLPDHARLLRGLNESPSEKEGKSRIGGGGTSEIEGLNESPSEKEGKCSARVRFTYSASLPQ